MPFFKILLRGAVLAVLVPLCSCTDPTGGGGALGVVELSPASPQLVVGESVQMEMYSESYGSVVGQGKIQWSTSNSGVASVDESGRVLAKTRGQAVIRGESHGRRPVPRPFERTRGRSRPVAR